MSLTFHSKGIEKFNPLNDSARKVCLYTRFHAQQSIYLKRFITIKVKYLRPHCGRHEQAAAFKPSTLAIRVVFSSYLKVGCAVLFRFGDTHP